MSTAVDRTDWHVIAFDTEWSYTSANSGTYLQPITATLAEKGLGYLVNYYGERVESPTLVLSGEVPSLFEIPDRAEFPDDRDEYATEHPALESIRDAGWEVDRLAPWMRCTREKRTVFVLVLDLDDSGESPLVHPDNPVATVNGLAEWQDHTGSIWWGNGQISGNALLWDMQLTAQDEARRNGKRPPKLDLRATRPRNVECTENPYTRRKWTSPLDEAAPGKLFGIDQRNAFLSATTSGLFAREALRPGPQEFDKTLSGFWLVEIAPWANELFPDPAGYSHETGARWVATPTLELVAELHARDEADPLWHAGFTVRRSMVAKGTQCLRPWAEKLRDTIAVSPEMAGAGKAAYTRAIGSWAAETPGSVNRIDWQRTIVSRSRSNLFRKVAKVWDEIGIPARSIATDCVYYPEEYREVIAETGVYRIGTGLGEFKLTEGK